MSDPRKEFRSSKTYGHDVGFSCAFRQWRAHDTHCRLVHGYALAFHIEFAATDLDVRNWVVDFGSMGSFKDLLRNTFDHKTIIAADDPHLDYFKQGHALGVLDLVVLDKAGCEAFAQLVFESLEVWLFDYGYSPRCRVVSVTVSEHGANSATYCESPLVPNFRSSDYDAPKDS